MTLVYPVIHHLNCATSVAQAALARDAGADGVFLISHNGKNSELAVTAYRIKDVLPGLKIGMNFLGWENVTAFDLAARQEEFVRQFAPGWRHQGKKRDQELMSDGRRSKVAGISRAWEVGMQKSFVAIVCWLTLFPAVASFAGEKASPERVLDAQLHFTSRLLVELARHAPGGSNLAISPASAAGVLSLLDIGSDGPMHRAIYRTLGFPETESRSISDMDALRSLFADEASERSPGRTDFTLATAVLIDPATSPYAKAIAEMQAMGARVEVASLNDVAAIGRINYWAAIQTKGRIPLVLENAPRQLGLITVNALYFKGLWLEPFREGTRLEPFHGSTQNFSASMMHRSGSFKFRADSRFAAVELPFLDDRYRLVLVTSPKRSLSLKELSRVGDWLGGAGFSQTELALGLPRFLLEGEVNLLDALAAAGLKDGLNSKTAFINISATPQGISEMRQKTYFRVDESGSEAVAVTSTRTELISAPLLRKFTFERPFLFALRDVQTGLVLLAGYIDHPQEKVKLAASDKK
jgi:serine protease inhibitor